MGDRPRRERGFWVRLGHPFRFALAILAIAVPLAGCGGGGDDGTKVEASLQHYLSSLDPQACLGSRYCEQGVFPLGAGVPDVRAKSCKKAHIGEVRSGWSCVITFRPGKTALPVAVAVKGNDEVYSAVLITQAPPLPPATVYEGGP